MAKSPDFLVLLEGSWFTTCKYKGCFEHEVTLKELWEALLEIQKPKRLQEKTDLINWIEETGFLSTAMVFPNTTFETFEYLICAYTTGESKEFLKLNSEFYLWKNDPQ